MQMRMNYVGRASSVSIRLARRCVSARLLRHPLGWQNPFAVRELSELLSNWICSR